MGGRQEVDVDALLEAGKTPTRTRCATCKWLDTRPVPERIRWDLHLKGDAYNGIEIQRAMAQVPGVEPPGRHSVQKHRTGKHWER
jgi:hypothetical protein